MTKEVKYDSVAQRFLTERDTKDVLGMLIAVLDKLFPKFFDDGVNELFPTKTGEPHATSYTKPQ